MESMQKTITTTWKNLGTKQWLAIFLLGILLTVISLPTTKTEKNTASYSAETTLTEKEKMEKNLEDLLTKVEGVGEIQVLLSVKEEKDAFYGTNRTLAVTGVLIVAQGADNPVVVREIQLAVQALFQIEAHKIKVMKRK